MLPTISGLAISATLARKVAASEKLVQLTAKKQQQLKKKKAKQVWHMIYLKQTLSLSHYIYIY